MFFKKKKAPAPTYDVTQKLVKTWWGGKKLVPTTKAEQNKMKAQILAREPDAVVIDAKAKKEQSLKWIDRVEEIDALL